MRHHHAGSGNCLPDFGACVLDEENSVSRQLWYHHPLVKEVALILVIKTVAIVLIGKLYFSDPVDVSQPGSRVSEQLGL